MNNAMKKILFILLTAVLLIGCSRSDDDNKNTSYDGRWTGTFSGDDSGSFAVDIKLGSVSGSAQSAKYNMSFSITGTVDTSGKMTATFGQTNSGSVFNGTLSGSSGSGSWTNTVANPTLKGSWTAKK